MQKNKKKFPKNVHKMCKKTFKQTFKTGFWVQNHLLNLCSSSVNSQRLLCSQKARVKCTSIKAFWYTKYLNYSIYVIQQKSLKILQNNNLKVCQKIRNPILR